MYTSDSQTPGTKRVNIRDINPLEHLTADLAKARFNYESMLNGLVEWNNSKLKNVTVRLMCDTDPGFVDYTFPSKLGSENLGINTADPDSTEDTYSYAQRYEVSAMASEDPLLNDRLDIRTTVTEGADASWKLCAGVAIYDEEYARTVWAYTGETDDDLVAHASDGVSDMAVDEIIGNILLEDGPNASSDYVKGQFIRITVPMYGVSYMRWASKNIVAGDAIADANTEKVFSQWTLRDMAKYTSEDASGYVHVIYNHKVYRPTGTIARVSPDNENSGWEYLCDEFYLEDGETFPLKHGKMYLYAPGGNYEYAELFIYNGSDTLYGYPPYELELTDGGINRIYNDGWVYPSVILLPITSDFTKTNSVRWTVPTDIESVVLLRTSDGDLGKMPEVRVLPTVRVVGGTTEDNGGLYIFDTSNYAEWPGTTPKWTMGHNYYTDPNLGVKDTQNYTATMIIDHANPNCKQCNIVNYDGPDLDQGLAIYLPVESTVNGKIVYPKNGRTFEFLFRIWPNAAYNGHETADLIINKAQIYVYSLPERKNVSCHGAPIAKFSMARLSTFHVFSENIAVPNRPVLYKAKFVYSADEKEWKTYGYYQIPDCIFLSPGGFIDPTMRSNDTYGVETAGFPLVQDPFSMYDMSPVMVDEEFRNRIG